MRTVDVTEYYAKRGTEFTVYNLTDLHIGARACNEKGIQGVIKEIAKNPNARWLGGGDFIDAICHVGDRRYKPSKIASWLAQEDDVIGVQRDYVCKMLAPIMDKCWGLVCGNHEFAALQWYGRDLYHEIVTILARVVKKPPPDLAITTHGFVNVKFRCGNPKKYGRTTSMPIYIAHGFGGGRLPGGDALMLYRLWAAYEARLILVGHRHKNMNLPFTRVLPAGRGAKGVQSYGVLCGTMLGAFITPPKKDKVATDTYVERAGYPPQAPGWPKIIVTPDRNELEVRNSISLEPVDLSFDS